ncbi:MAG TPA: NAD(P)/FAD-dependent oxidoreductase [Ignavibacteria bacterium]|nr:NAD(P)/FAD-dependent oxidoreductase [Ignavibacteria bacterium]
MKKITINGAGLAGSLLAIYLAKKGYDVDVFEKRPDMRIKDTGGGRSINLALSVRGIQALKEVGLYEEIKQICIPMYGRMIHSIDGQTTFLRYGKDDSEYINSVSRAELNMKLMNMAEQYKNVNLYFNRRCTGINFETNEINYFNEVLNTNENINPEILIATDGATSPVRVEMLKLPRFNFSQEYENYGYKELNIPADKNGNHMLEKNCLHIWPRGSYMLIALPNMDGSFTCTLFMAYDELLGGKNSFEYVNSPDRLKYFLNENFIDVIGLMPELEDDYFKNPTGTLITIKCFPWIHNKIALLGDSAHAIVPFFGQGMNAAFEDCVYLNGYIEKFGDDWNKILDEYQKDRKVNADAIADLAQENFIEMRDLVATEKFQFKKKIESELYKKYPTRFIPKYTMVTFMRIPYKTALVRGKIQEKILNQLSDGISDLEKVNWSLAEKLIDFQLSEI